MPDLPRAPSGYRRYPPDAKDRLGFIRRAKHLAFTLDEIASLLSLEEEGENTEVKHMARDKLVEIDARLRDLKDIRTTLAGLENDARVIAQ